MEVASAFGLNCVPSASTQPCSSGLSSGLSGYQTHEIICSHFLWVVFGVFLLHLVGPNQAHWLLTQQSRKARFQGPCWLWHHQGSWDKSVLQTDMEHLIRCFLLAVPKGHMARASLPFSFSSIYLIHLLLSKPKVRDRLSGHLWRSLHCALFLFFSYYHGPVSLPSYHILLPLNANENLMDKRKAPLYSMSIPVT